MQIKCGYFAARGLGNLSKNNFSSVNVEPLYSKSVI